MRESKSIGNHFDALKRRVSESVNFMFPFAWADAKMYVNDRKHLVYRNGFSYISHQRCDREMVIAFVLSFLLAFFLSSPSLPNSIRFYFEFPFHNVSHIA